MFSTQTQEKEDLSFHWVLSDTWGFLSRSGMDTLTEATLVTIDKIGEENINTTPCWECLRRWKYVHSWSRTWPLAGHYPGLSKFQLVWTNFKIVHITVGSQKTAKTITFKCKLLGNSEVALKFYSIKLKILKSLSSVHVRRPYSKNFTPSRSSTYTLPFSYFSSWIPLVIFYSNGAVSRAKSKFNSSSVQWASFIWRT